jgi:hypothetical protein
MRCIVHGKGLLHAGVHVMLKVRLGGSPLPTQQLVQGRWWTQPSGALVSIQG